ncbi:MAG: dienelactone hydrolase family protein [Candidatus Kariarchaeaceae archaeon]
MNTIIRQLVNYTPLPIRIETRNEDNDGEVTVRDAILHSGDRSVSVYLVIPDGEGPFPAIHFIHWLETHARDSNKDQFLPMAKELAQQGIVSILPDCFWSVDKDIFDKDPTSYTSKWWKTDKDHDLTLIKNQLIELKIVEDYLLSLTIVDRTRVSLGAHDFGAMFACLLSQLGYSYRSYAFMAMTAHFSDWFRFGSKLSEEELASYIEALAFTAPIEAISELPSGSVHLGFASNDFYVPLEVAERIVNATQEPTVKHYEAEHGMNEDAFTDLKNWLRTSLLG